LKQQILEKGGGRIDNNSAGTEPVHNPNSHTTEDLLSMLSGTFVLKSQRQGLPPQWRKISQPSHQSIETKVASVESAVAGPEGQAAPNNPGYVSNHTPAGAQGMAESNSDPCSSASQSRKTDTDKTGENTVSFPQIKMVRSYV
jgi:hypothetical protein